MTDIAREAPLSGEARSRVVMPFLIVVAIWGSTWLVITGQLNSVPPAWSVAYRFLIAAVAMFAFGLWRGESMRLDRHAAGVVLLIGVTQFALNFNLVYLAEVHVTSGLVAVVFSLLVVPNAILGWIFLRQGISLPFLWGSLVAMGGVAMLFMHEVRSAGTRGDEIVMGVVITLVGVLSASIANIAQGSDRVKHLPMPALLGWAMLVGGLMDAVWALATTGAPRFDWSPAYIAGLLYLALVASAFAFMIYFPLIRAIGAARAAYSSVLVPIVAMSLSTIFEDYVWTWPAALGGALVIGGLVVALRARSPAR